ncbi:flavodoxin family protein [Ornithinibacillus scapharcae]|uniref:flavodoxin family protein n=1 Tax=Ornithinibacillus scapharcae TaxID=1147159 RepID=UPI000225B828|nr:flavodoxin family protein [Ornithinibacillus scapharcae]
MSIMIIYGGTRENGNTEVLTETAVEGLNVERIHLKDYTILPIEDLRHSVDGFHKVNDDYYSIINQMEKHDIIIFATPIYWYSMSGLMKNFIDRWSQTLKESNGDFKKKMATKKAYVIAVGGDEPQIKGLPMIQQFYYIFDFVGVSFEGYILGHANRPGEILSDINSLRMAELFLQKLKNHSSL